MDTVTLHCPDCGAPASPDATVCAYCHARLATVACPSCFGLVFRGMAHCPHCGAAIARAAPAADTPLDCPRCRGSMEPKDLGPSRVRECAACAGVWVDNATFMAVCRERERQAPLLPTGPAPAYAVAAGGIDVHVAYLRCPVCAEMLNRVNFGRISGVVVDVCREHGTFFDRDELRRIVEFIRARGLERARDRVKTEATEMRLGDVAAGLPSVIHVPSDEEAWRTLFAPFTPVARG